ncbi:MAG: histidine phosphatase family protein [Dehalococcoidia bacterium]|nr:histidine phosphatase family protein [Dehalococcoidia bacterium]
MRIILVRHGETRWNREHRIQGLADLDLNETGRKQAQALAEALRNERVSAIYTSPLRRAMDTAAAIARYHPVEMTVLDGLKELDAGEVDGMTYDEMRENHADFLVKWLEDCSSIRVPGGCTLQELQDQVWSAIDHIRSRHEVDEDQAVQERSIVVVAHFFPILSILCKALSLDLSQCRRLRLGLASICTLDFNSDRIVLVSMNDTCHLKQLG